MFSSSNLHGDDREDYALYRNRQISAGYSNEIKFELPPRGIRVTIGFGVILLIFVKNLSRRILLRRILGRNRTSKE